MSVAEQPKAVERGAEIVTAALRVIVHEGIDGVRSQRVADEAGVSVALPHYYYPTLDDLVRAVWERIDAEQAERDATLLGTAAAPVERLRAFVRDAFAGSTTEVRERWMARTEFQRRAVFDIELGDAVRAAERRRLAALAAAVAEARAAGDIATGVDAELIAGRIAGAIDGFGVMLLVGLVSPEAATAELDALVDGSGRWRSPRRLAVPAVPPQPVDAEPDRRTLILDAAIGLIAREGIAGLHFPEVAEAAGVSRSLPRYYYRTLDDLLRAVFERDAEVARRRVEWRAEHIDDPLERLRDAYAHAIVADPEGVRPSWVLWFEQLRIAARDPSARRRASTRLADWIAYDTAILRELRRVGTIGADVDIDGAEQRLIAIDNGAGALWMLGVLSAQRYGEIVDAAVDDELGLS